MDLNSVMTANPACCTRNTPLRQVAQMMIDHDCGLIPVVDDGNKPLGVVTDRDIATRIVAGDQDAGRATAGDAMTTPCKSVTSATGLHECLSLMEADQVRRVPVVDAAGALVGIVSIADIALAGKDDATVKVVKSVSEPQH